MGTPSDELQNLNADHDRLCTPRKRGKLATHNGIAPVEQQHCEEEIAKLQRELTAAVGLGGKSRDLNSEADKLRPRIYANLARAYKALRGAVPPMKELADHFEAAISAEGFTYVYRPVGDIPAWSVDLPPEVAR